MPANRINLVFCCYPKKGAVPDFRAAAARIAAADPGISAHVVSTAFDLSALAAPLRFLGRPTLWIELDTVKFFRPLRGARLSHPRGTGKIAQMRMFEGAGLPVAKWALIEPGAVFDPQEWGPYVVEKPVRGRRGANTVIRKTGRVRYVPPEKLPADHLGRRSGMLVQKFVYTGRWPVSYRVLTYFGEPLFALRQEGSRSRLPLDGPTAFAEAGGVAIVASARGGTAALVEDADVLDLARRVHALFPNAPTLGVDILREVGSGRLYVSEANAGGNSWSIGDNQAGRDYVRDLKVEGVREQFGLVDIIARISADLARRLAR